MKNMMPSIPTNRVKKIKEKPGAAVKECDVVG